MGPPKFAVDKLHAAGVLVMNMIGAPKHVKKALDAGVDIICAQGGEGGGHTGGIVDGRGLAMALQLGADAVWVGTRFVASKEAGAPKRHKEALVKSSVHDTIRTLIYTGRPLRCVKTPFIMDWENNRAEEIKDLCARGIVPV